MLMIHLSHKYLLSTNYMLEIHLGADDTVTEKKDLSFNDKDKVLWDVATVSFSRYKVEPFSHI